MKKIISIIMFALLMISSIAYAEDTTSANTDTTTSASTDTTSSTTTESAATADTISLEDSAIATEAVPQEQVDSAIATEVSENALTGLTDGVKYAFTFNKEKKAELSLDIAKRKLLLARKQMQKNNTQAAQNAQEQYARWTQKAEEIMKKLPAETKLENAARIQNRLDLNDKIVDRIRLILENSTASDSPLNVADRDKIMARLTTANSNAMQIRLIMEQRIGLIEKRMGEIENLTSEEIETRRIEARLGNNTIGNAASAEAFIRIAKNDVEKAKSIIESITAADSANDADSANAANIEKAKETIANAEAEIALAEASKDQGKYVDAKEHAMKARRIVMNAYIRSKFNALSQNAKYEIAKMTPEQRAKMQERARQMSNNTRLAPIQNRIDDKLNNRLDKLENRSENLKDRLAVRFGDEPQGKMCAQVITPAINAQGNCVEYPTPCDVPQGWRRVASCSNTVANTISEVTEPTPSTATTAGTTATTTGQGQ